MVVLGKGSLTGWSQFPVSQCCVPALPPQNLSQCFLWGPYLTPSFTPWAQAWGVEGQTQEERSFAPRVLWWDNAAAL